MTGRFADIMKCGIRIDPQGILPPTPVADVGGKHSLHTTYSLPTSLASRNLHSGDPVFNLKYRNSQTAPWLKVRSSS